MSFQIHNFRHHFLKIKVYSSTFCIVLDLTFIVQTPHRRYFLQIALYRTSSGSRLRNVIYSWCTARRASIFPSMPPSPRQCNFHYHGKFPSLQISSWADDITSSILSVRVNLAENAPSRLSMLCYLD